MKKIFKLFAALALLLLGLWPGEAKGLPSPMYGYPFSNVIVSTCQYVGDIWTVTLYFNFQSENREKVVIEDVSGSPWVFAQSTQLDLYSRVPNNYDGTEDHSYGLTLRFRPNLSGETMKGTIYIHTLDHGDIALANAEQPSLPPPALQVGTISSSQTLFSGETPWPLNCQAASGGSGSYSYQWQYSNDNVNWTNWGSVTWSPQSLQPGAFDNYGPENFVRHYRVEVRSGTQAAYSNTVTITMYAKVQARISPERQYVESGQTPGAFTAVATGGQGSGYNYVWQVADANWNWTPYIPGAGYQTYTPPAETNHGTTDVTRYYRVLVTSLRETVESETFGAVVIRPAIRPGTISPGSSTIEAGRHAPQLTLSGTVGVFARQWQQRIDFGAWTDIPGANGEQYSPGVLTNTGNASISYEYRVRVNNTELYSTTTQFIVNPYPPLDLSVTPKTQYKHAGAQADPIRAVATGGDGNYTYHWEVNTGQGWSPTGVTTSTLHPGILQNTTSGNLVYQYRVTVASAGRTAGGEATITIDPTMGSDVEYGRDEWFIPYVSLRNDFDPSGGEGTLIIDFTTADEPNGEFNVSASSGTFRITGSDGGYTGSVDPDGHYICSMTVHYAANTGEQALRGNIQVYTGMQATEFTLNNLVQPATLRVQGMVNAGQLLRYPDRPLEISVSSVTGGNGYGYTYQWQTAPLNSADWSDIAGATGAAYTPPGPPEVSEDRYYRVLVTCGTQSAASPTASVRLNPLYIHPIPGGDRTVSSGAVPEAFVVTVEGGYNPSSRVYQWQTSPDRQSWTDIAGATDASYTPEAITNEGEGNIVSYYRVEVNSSGQIETSGPVGVTVLPRHAVIPDAGANYTVTYRPRQALAPGSALNSANSAVDITYYDGLGRPAQQIAVAASPAGRDVVTPIVYDAAGRADATAYLPYASAGQTNGQRKTDPLAEQRAFYGVLFPDDPDLDYAYASNNYGAYGLVASNSGPGQSSATHPVEYEYRLNTEGELRRYRMAGEVTVIGDPKNLYYNGNWPAGTLRVTRSEQQGLPTDQQSATLTYVDAAGRTVATGTSAGNQRQITYYVYDELGHQRYVIPPAQDKQIHSYGTIAPNDMTLYGYYTEYDDHGRPAVQYNPRGEQTSSVVSSVYDLRGRLAFTQDGNQLYTEGRRWSFTKYDDLDRPVMTGIVTGGTQESHRLALRYQTTHGETRGGALHGYTNVTYPIVDPSEAYVITYYDDYDGLDGSHTFVPDELADSYDATPLGMVTGTRTKVLGIDTDQWLTSVTYYDEEGRSVQSVADLYPSGTERVSNSHDFAGNVTHTRVSQTVGGTTHRYDKWFDYDDAGRLVAVRQQIAGDEEVTLAAYTYDELGRVSTKGLHGGAETIDYAYNLAGVPLGQRSESFSYTLWTDRAPAGLTPRHDGRLTAFTWGRGNTAEDKGYSLGYDKSGNMNQALSIGLSTENWSLTGAFDERVLYDYNASGDIISMKRTDANGAMLHDLFYDHAFGNWGVKSNRLLRIHDILNNSQVSEEFVYDNNGNMTHDGSTGVGIEYNALNLPARIFANDEEIRYIYSAAGEKLATVAADGSLTNYRSVMVWEQPAGGTEALSYILHPEGFASRMGSGDYVYRYFLSDHIGSVRTVLEATASGMVAVQATDYYPYGLPHALNNTHLNRYLFSGKELQDQTLGGSPLGLYDFHARFYNPLLGRWFNPDPARQFANPYVYGGNSPLMYRDKDGRFAFLIPIIVGAWIGGVSYGASAALSPNGLENLSMQGFFTSMIAGAIGGGVGAGVGGLLASGGSGFLGGAITGASGGFAGGASYAWMNGASFGQGLGAGMIGAGSGALLGGLSRGIIDRSRGYSFWNGSKVIGESMATSLGSGRAYTTADLQAMANQAKADAGALWGAKVGKNGLLDISTTLNADAIKRGYTYQNGMFVNSSGTNVDGFTLGYSGGGARAFLAPDVAASRLAGGSNYSITTITGGNIRIEALSARYVSTLGHELIHVENWFNKGTMLPQDWQRYSEHAGYSFSKHVEYMFPNRIQEFNAIMQSMGWTTPHSAFRTTSIFAY